MLTKCIPFFTDNNSCNLPFYLLKDEKDNDVIYIKDSNIVYLNIKNSSVNYQIQIYKLCLNKGICSTYPISDSLIILKETDNNFIHWYILDEEQKINLYQTETKDSESIQVHFNKYYICITNLEYGECIPSIVGGYDINNKKIIDCDSFESSNALYKSLVEIRRCRYDCILSILSGKILVKDETILYKFLSFILMINVNNHNINNCMELVKPIVLQKYPELVNDVISFDRDVIKEKCLQYGVNYFWFNRIEKIIPNLSYQRQKVLKNDE